MNGDRKGEIISKAFSLMRVSGLTVSAGANEQQDALIVLETMAHEYGARNICVGYNFEDDPDLNSLHNMEPKYWFSFSACLAMRLATDFGKGKPDRLDPTLQQKAATAFSFLSSDTAMVRPVAYPSRQPVGAGNDRWGYSRFWRYYPPAVQAPLECATNTMYLDDINDFTEHFDAWLASGETVSSYALTADTGLTVQSESLTSPDIDYRIKAEGTNENTGNALLQVKIVATSSLGRVTTRIINFEILNVEINP